MAQTTLKHMRIQFGEAIESFGSIDANIEPVGVCMDLATQSTVR